MIDHDSAVQVASKLLSEARRSRDPRVKLIAVLNQPLAQIAVTIRDRVSSEVDRGNTYVDQIAGSIFDDLLERARQVHTEEVVEQLLAFAAMHPHPAVKSITLLKQPASVIVTRVYRTVDSHVTSGIHEAEDIARAILRSLIDQER